MRSLRSFIVVPPTPSVHIENTQSIVSHADTAWILIRQNLGVCEAYDVCPREIESLLRNAISRQSDYPHMAKSDIIGCLCPDGKCTPRPTMGLNSIKVVYDCLECEDECSICLNPCEDDMCIITRCKHIFHRSCFFKIPENSLGNWKPCPLCRTHVSGKSFVQIEREFRKWSTCKCCDHHMRRRPSEFNARDPNVEHIAKCSNPRAMAILELLFRLRERTPTCHCSCRSEMRRLCRLLI